MLGSTVIAGEFFTGLDAAQGIELDSVVGDPYVRIRVAGVIHVAQRACSFYGGINGAFVHFHDGNSLQAFGAAAGFAHRDSFASELADFPARGDGRVSEQASPLDLAFSLAKHGHIIA